MDLIKFKTWLIGAGKNKANVANIVSRCNRVAAYYDIEEEFIKDECVSLLDLFTYTKTDWQEGMEPSHNIPIAGNYYYGTESLRSAIKTYVKFLQANPIPTKKKKTKAVATYSGNAKGFIDFVGAYCRNKVNSITRSDRNKRHGICEYCGKKDVLESAHTNGKERPQIIAEILENNFKVSNDYYEVDLVEFEKLFVANHFPVKDHIYFLCKDCHNAYDGRGTKRISTASMKAKCGH